MSLIAPSVHVAQYLGENAVGSLGDDLFAGEWGRSDSQILVLDGVGGPAADPKELYEHVGIQILCRGAKRDTHAAVYAKAKEVSDFLLLSPESIEIDTVCYLGFEPSSNVVNLGKDKEERFIFSANFLTYRNRT